MIKDFNSSSLSIGVLLRVYVWVLSFTRQMSGCLVLRYGRCLLTVKSPGWGSLADRYRVHEMDKKNPVGLRYAV